MDVPVIFDVQEMIDWCLYERGMDWIDREALDLMLSRVGRNSGPLLMATLHAEGHLDESALHLVGEVWGMAEYPARCLFPKEWRDLFTDAGYTSDGRPASRPSHTMRLYRGCPPEGRYGWSWSDDIEVARSFAKSRLRGRPLGILWTAEVEPHRLFCRDSSREESEYVVDTASLDIKAHDTD